ncbi:alpha-1,4-glucan--maltose-1-phosphate maltosyltransferase [Gulosibacter sp. 10]|uniref:alpha-1,4-glucan--maltose-1-phosphate maltosyltransferase n=1 Tax=Gulosibacter sp. 10 TaxID=1255570 RepID=UPI0020CFE22D|nr:alpha-1,4-glucan--maltose-1-phosphate maltosyltransferase [Gulosibacter sp. 10]
MPIMRLRPQIEDALFPSKAYAGEVVPFSCVSFREGHDKIGVDLVLTDPDGRTRRRRLERGRPGLDEWRTTAQLDREGEWRWRAESFGDDFATWRHNAEIKVPAGIDVEVMLEEGARVLDRAAAGRGVEPETLRALEQASATAREKALQPLERLRALLDERIIDHLTAQPVRSLVTRSEERVIRVERKRAGYGAWYEFFPRSEGAVPNADGSWRSGTFRTAAERLPGVADMGFDVVYLPPIHPIGRTNRKGPNNTLTPGPNDPGSPWAIGAETGGHRDVHPDLGTLDDFKAFRERAEGLGLEIALDLALQATPDHPWVREHPEWFTTLADGSIAYAENPPKKYQDIYPVNFDNDPEGIYREVLDIVRHWIDAGVKIFRVDNPHTKPLQFWERLIHEINAAHPEVVFLAEAFTRPAVMQSLAKAGFQQSYSYFTWRNTREELEEFLDEVSHETSDFMRPNLFVNTPDILTEYLQRGGRPAYEARAVIAAMAGPNWGMYSGFELVENVARPGAEENIDNEKYEYKQRNWEAEEASGRSLAPLIRKLNGIRRAHPALHQLRNFEVQSADHPSIFAFSKTLEAEYAEHGIADTIITVVNIDPFDTHEATLAVDSEKFGIPRGDGFQVEDLLSGQIWDWSDYNYVRLAPGQAHVLHVRHH